MDYLGPFPLSNDHDRTSFACTEDALTTFLAEQAGQSQRKNALRTFVILHPKNQKVIGYYTLVYGSVDKEYATEDAARRQSAKVPIPIVKIAKLAIHKDFEGKKLGTALINDAFEKAKEASQLAGLVAIVLDAKNDAKGFYIKKGFEESPVKPLLYFVTIKDLFELAAD